MTHDLPSQILAGATTTESWSVGFPTWPNWGQLVDWTSDGNPDENKANNCVPESLAMCIKYLTRVELPADFIKDTEYGEQYTGFTDFNHASHFLKRYCEIGSHQWYHTSHPDTLWEVWRALDKGNPVIGLFQYGGSTSGTHHAMPYVYLDPGKVIVSDPWTGMQRSFSYTEHDSWSLYAGLTIDQVRYV